MTILDTDRRERKCPVCGKARLIFITVAPKIRSAENMVCYRCKACAIEEARATGDPLEVMHHRERQGLPAAWKNDRLGAQPERLKIAQEKRRERLYKPIPDASDEKAGSPVVREFQRRKNAASSEAAG